MVHAKVSTSCKILYFSLTYFDEKYNILSAGIIKIIKILYFKDVKLNKYLTAFPR